MTHLVGGTKNCRDFIRIGRGCVSFEIIRLRLVLTYPGNIHAKIKTIILSKLQLKLVKDNKKNVEDIVMLSCNWLLWLWCLFSNYGSESLKSNKQNVIQGQSQFEWFLKNIF